MTICKNCGILLTEVNWKLWVRDRCDNRCYPCVRKYENAKKREFYRTDKGKEQYKRKRKWFIENYLGVRINDKNTYIRVKKRPYPGHCELCDKVNIKIMYHHWNKDRPDIGMWICQNCHNKAEAIENKEFEDRYINLKRKIELESK